MRWYKLFSLWEFLIFLFSLSLFLFLLYFYFYGMSSSFTNKGMKLLQDKKWTQAQKNFHLALAEDKSNPWSYLNVALGYDLLKSPNKSLKTYDIVSSHLKKTSNTALFYAYFNKGELQGRLGQRKDALYNYQQALEFQYKEKEIKTNIELLFQTDRKSNQEHEKEKPSDKKREKQKENKKSGKNQSEQEEGQSDQQKEEQEGKDQSEQKKDQSEQKKDQSEQKKDQSEQKEEQEGKDQSEQKEEQEGKDQSEQKEKQFNQQKENQGQQTGTYQTPQEQILKELNNKQEEAIFEELEKQENKARSKIYQRKNIFGDKTKEDW